MAMPLTVEDQSRRVADLGRRRIHQIVNLADLMFVVSMAAGGVGAFMGARNAAAGTLTICILSLTCLVIGSVASLGMKKFFYFILDAKRIPNALKGWVSVYFPIVFALGMTASGYALANWLARQVL